MNRNGPFSRAEVRQFIKQAKASCERWKVRAGAICWNEEVTNRCPSCRARAILKAIGRPLIRKIPKWKREQDEKYEALKKLYKKRRRQNEQS